MLAIAAALSVAVHVWLARSVFVPLVRDDRVAEHVFISASAGALIAIALVTSALVFLIHVLVRRVTATRADQPAPWSYEDVAYARPLFCFALSALGLLNLVPALARVLPVVSYVIVDLRWWWTTLVVVWWARSLDERLGGAWRSGLARIQVPIAVRRFVPELALAGIAIVWAVAGTPILRLEGGTHGDEPKYVRFCENLYQGRGFDVSQIKPMSDLPADFRPRVGRNLVLLARVIPGDLRNLAHDAVELVRHPSRRFNLALHLEGGFLDGKNGGVYQVHNPGVSLLMFPAYYVDRQLAPMGSGASLQWPRRLPVVNGFFVALYAVWAVLIFRFLRRCGGTTPVAWIASLAFILTLPAAAFPFQYYPELAAGLFVTAIGNHLLFGEPRNHRASFFFGLMAGYLPWLHVRFSIVAAALVFGALVLWRGQWRRVVLFVAGLAIPVTLFSLYAYHVTGSALPSALWSAEGSEENFRWVGMVKSIPAYLVDRDWGLFAHSPVFLLVLPGYWWMARRRPAIAGLNALVLLALLLPSAGKTLVATTPMRLIVAVVPLGATPLIELLGRRRDRVVQIIFGLLLILSLDNALAYNLYHYRHIPLLVDSSFSGWKVNLLFPSESRRPWTISAANGFLFVGWMVVIFALLCGPAVIHWARERQWKSFRGSLGARSIARSSCVATGLFVALGTAISAATGVWTTPSYIIPADEAAQKAALKVDNLGHCTLCVSSYFGRSDTQRIVTQLEAVDPSVAARQRPGVDERGYKEWLEMPGHIRAWYLEANGREPSTADIGNYLYLWREEHAPPAEVRRRIFSSAGRTP